MKEDQPLQPEDPSDDSTSLQEAGALLEAYREAMQQGHHEQAEAFAIQVLAFASEQVGKEPSQDLLLAEEAHQWEAEGQWGKAEAAYRQALALAEAEGSPMMEYNAHDDLSGLYSFLGQEERAFAEAEAAAKAARRVKMVPLLSMALDGQARCALSIGNPSLALSLMNELLALLPKKDRMKDLSRARALTLRARCYVEIGQWEQVQADLEAAWPLLEPLSGSVMMAGVQSGLANWWSVTATLRHRQGDFAGAAEAMREAVTYRRRVSQAPQLEGPYKFSHLANSLHKLGLALLAIEDVKGAEAAFQECRAIRQAIGQP